MTIKELTANLDITAPKSTSLLPLVERIRPLRPKVQIGIFQLDKITFEELAPEDLLNLARLNVGQPISASSRRKLEQLCPDIMPDVLGRKCLSSTELILALYEIQKRKQWAGFIGNDIDHILTSFADSNFVEETYESTNFIITYQTDGSQGVDPSKASMDIVDPGSNPAVVLDTIPAGGPADPPTYIRLVAFWLERALASYVNAPFSLLNPASAGKIPVYVNHSNSGSASPSGYFSIHWSLTPGLICAVSVHELFHMVQFKYSLTTTDPWRWSIMEGGAVLSEDVAADAMNRYLYEASTSWNGTGILADPNASMKSLGYDCALFWRYIAEQQSPDITEPYIGVETYRTLIETCATDGCTTAAVEKAIRTLPWHEDFYKFGYMDPARLDLLSNETILGNFYLALYLKSLGANTPDARFDFLEDEENIRFDEVLNAQWPNAGPIVDSLHSVTLTASDTLTSSTALNYSDSVNSFASRYYEVRIDSAVTNVHINFTAGASLTGAIFQIVQIDANDHVRDIHRTDRTAYTKRIANVQDGIALDRLAIVVTGAEASGSFTIGVTSAPPTSDVMVTRWNSLKGKEYELRSRYWSWVSPDIWVDNDSNGLADSEVYFNFNNKLTIRLHNKGNADAADIKVNFWYQDADNNLQDSEWLPVRNKDGVAQGLNGLNLAAGASSTFVVDWSPIPSGSSKHFCVRAVVTSSGDVNTDNKRLTSNFGNVIFKKGTFAQIDIHLFRRHFQPHPKPVRLELITRMEPQSENVVKINALAVNRSEILLSPGEVITDRIRIMGNPEVRHAANVAPTAGLSAILPIKNRTQGLLDAYPPADALPPGVWGKPLVTMVQKVEGVATGGVTLAINFVES